MSVKKKRRRRKRRQALSNEGTMRGAEGTWCKRGQKENRQIAGGSRPD